MASSQTSGTCPSGHGMGTRSKSRKRERESQGQRKTAKGKKSTLYTTSVDDESAGAVGDEELSSVASSQTSGTCSTGHGMDTRLKSPTREQENQGQQKTDKAAEETEGTSRLFEYTTSGRIGVENAQRCSKSTRINN